MKELFKKTLEQIRFSQKYIDVCNKFHDFDKGKNFNKNEVLEILNVFSWKLSYASKDKSFYQDYDYKYFKGRFTFTYKYGFIECFYVFWNKRTEERIRGRFNSIALIEDNDFESKVTYKFPIATSLNDLEGILKSLYKLHTNFIKTLEQKINNTT